MHDDGPCNDPACGCGGPAESGLRPPPAHLPRAWRPKPVLRVISIAVFRHQDRILAAPVHDDEGQIKGWRPLGGGVEFGERAEAALRREIAEETGQDIAVGQRIGVVENLFEHEEALGHEIVFVFEAVLKNEALYAAEQLAFSEHPGQEETAKWISLDKARAGRIALFPDGLIDLL